MRVNNLDIACDLAYKEMQPGQSLTISEFTKRADPYWGYLQAVPKGAEIPHLGTGAVNAWVDRAVSEGKIGFDAGPPRSVIKEIAHS